MQYGLPLVLTSPNQRDTVLSAFSHTSYPSVLAFPQVARGKLGIKMQATQRFNPPSIALVAVNYEVFYCLFQYCSVGDLLPFCISSGFSMLAFFPI